MKKIFKSLLILAALLVSVTGAEAKLIGLGVSGGTNVSKYSFADESVSVENKAGYQFGIHAKIAVPILSVTPELLYIQNKFNITALNQTTEVKVQSIDAPIVAGISLLPMITLEAGPRFSLYNDAKAGDVSFGRIKPSVGYVIGAKFTLLGKVSVGARYNGEFGDYNTELLGDISSHSYSISVGYNF